MDSRGKSRPAETRRPLDVARRLSRLLAREGVPGTEDGNPRHRRGPDRVSSPPAHTSPARRRTRGGNTRGGRAAWTKVRGGAPPLARVETPHSAGAEGSGPPH